MNNNQILNIQIPITTNQDKNENREKDETSTEHEGKKYIQEQLIRDLPQKLRETEASEKNNTQKRR